MTNNDVKFVGALARIAIMMAWQAGELSEGQVCRVLKVDRITARTERDQIIESGKKLFNDIRDHA